MPGERGRIVGGAILPTARENAEPLACQGPYSGLVRLALVTLLRVLAVCPEGMPRGFRRPCHARVSEERRTLETPVPPGLLATALRDRRDTRVFLELLSRGVAFPLCATGPEEARSTNGTGTWQGVKQGAGGMVLGARRDGFVAVVEGVQGHAELGHEGVHQQGVGEDDACIRGQRHSALAGLEARRDDVGRAHVVGTEAALKSRATRELHGLERRPVAQAVTKEGGILLVKPRQDVREGVCEGPGHAMRQTDGVADQATAVCDAWRQGAPGGGCAGSGG